MDPEPRAHELTDQLNIFRLLADLLAQHLQTEEALAENERALLGERRTSELREQFMAVLGHDLRNPLQSILLASDTLLESETGIPEPKAVYRRIQRSASRISEMVEALLDFARGRLGDGIPIEPRAIESVGSLLRTVVEEFEDRYPNRPIHLETRGPQQARWDPGRMAQTFSNLLANALEHGAEDSPVRVLVTADGSDVVVSVTNHGPPIPPEILPRIFEPFQRNQEAATGSRSGLGLGLYVADQVVTAHGGTVSVKSDAEATTFTVRMPRRAEATVPD